MRLSPGVMPRLPSYLVTLYFPYAILLQRFRSVRLSKLLGVSNFRWTMEK